MEISRYWRCQETRYGTATGGLKGEVCPHCDEKIFPPRDVCPNCARQAKTPYVFSGKGEVYSHTTVYEGQDLPEGFTGQAPITFALVRLESDGVEPGPLILGQITDVHSPELRAQIQIGTPVEMVTRKIREDGDRGILVYGYKFRPVEETVE